jgi:predicted Holliday junction resolvase-like endonuclease
VERVKYVGMIVIVLLVVYVVALIAIAMIVNIQLLMNQTMPNESNNTKQKKRINDKTREVSKRSI